MKKLCWNGFIAFYKENYIVLSCIGWIGLYDLRFGKKYSASQNFSSVLAILLTTFSVGYPLIVGLFYFINFKPIIRSFELAPGQTV